jgi:hypothetical protein
VLSVWSIGGDIRTLGLLLEVRGCGDLYTEDNADVQALWQALFAG